MRRLLVLLASLALLAHPAAAQDANPDHGADTEAVARAAMARLRSPYTASHTVDMCPSAGALRDSIRVAAASGLTTNEIVEDVISRHGEQLRLLPKRSGVGLWAWLMPVAALLAGAAVVYVRIRRGRAAVPTGPVHAPLDERDRARLARALQSWEAEGEARP